MTRVTSIHSLLLFILSIASLAFSAGAFRTPNKPNVFQKALLRMGRGKKLREKVVERYFDGVQKQDRKQIMSCFSPLGTTIRDVCGVPNSERLATPEELGNRCMEFLAAHPNTQVKFHYPPTCGRGSSKWIFANWYEVGTFSGKSRGIEPDGSELDVEGQTRFFVDNNLKTTDMVVTRTFSVWEKQLQAASSNS